MSDNGLMCRPWLEQFDYPSPNKFPKTILNAKELPQNLNWQTDRKQIESSLPLTTFLYTEVCENYCRSPFNKDTYTNFMEKLQVPRVLNGKKDVQVLLKPPFVVSYDSMAVDAGLGTKQRATAEMLNKWCLLPQFIHILMAHKYNMSIVEAAKDPKVARLVTYAMRYHVHNHGFSNIGGHACMPMYDLQFTQCLGKDQTQLILAALYLTEIINATLTTIHDDDGYLSGTKQDVLTALRRKKLLKETKEVSLLLSTMNIYANCPGIDRMISELGKKIHFVNIFSRLRQQDLQ